MRGVLQMRKWIRDKRTERNDKRAERKKVLDDIRVDEELRLLDNLARSRIRYLLVVSLVSFALGALVVTTTTLHYIVTASLIGFSGSAVAALTSCLDRYAKGFERENGDPFPPAAKGDKFNRRFSYWLRARPFLGAIVAPVFIWGLTFFTDMASDFTSSRDLLGFTAFMSGLLAKSIVDLIKNLFKNVFNA
jgi:uncharacterized membrane protein